MNKNKITAVLGPTNTGKTFLAIETMLSFQSGMMGFPLRLLAREVYDKVKKKTDPNKVALITGEEKIIPSNAKYYLCTVESMPIEKNLEFVGIDEIQMCSDDERGHIFSDRLLSLRGEKLTMFMGSNTIKNIISKLDGDLEFINKERLSKLVFSGHKKISRIERKSAIIAFSAEEVYAIAELVRRQKGGASIVMGSLSPKTRNSQVELYQSGDVDFLVATDAIGMGINMDLDNVYFSSLKKFDGKKLRRLSLSEIGQIAGRAGRYMNDGNFGVTGECENLTPEEIAKGAGYRRLRKVISNLEDYEKAINETTALLLKVHPSNYQIVGFTEMPEMHEIVELGQRYGIPTVEDLGSGSLVDLTKYSLPNEPIVRDRIDAGVDLVLFSGDKLLGGSQAGIIVGKEEMVEKIRENPIMRALRVGKLTIAVLESTLRLYLNDLNLDKKLPMLRCYTRRLDELQQVGNQLLRRLDEIFGQKIQVSIEKSLAQIGSGSLPVANLPSLSIVLKSDQLAADSIAERFRTQPRSIIGRVKDGCFWIDLRTVNDREIEWICEAARLIN